MNVCASVFLPSYSYLILEIIGLLCMKFQLKAMIIIAWNGSGDISAIFETDVFKKVLSIFITAAILKLAQGKINYGNILMLIIHPGFGHSC